MPKKPYEKDLLEEVLNRNRRKLARARFRESKKAGSSSKQGKNNVISYKISQNRKKLASVFKVIAYQKHHSFLYNVIGYTEGKSDYVENELGEKISLNNLYKETQRWNLLKDEDNMKSTAKLNEDGSVNRDDLRNRQVCHAMFSLPKNITDKETFHKAMRESLAELFPYNKYCFGIHNNPQDTDNMHCHVMIKTRNEITNQQLNLSKWDIYKIQKSIDTKCKEFGLDLGSEEKRKAEKRRLENKRKKENAVYQPRLPKWYGERAPDWQLMYSFNNFPKISANKSTLDKLKEIGMSEEKIRSFLHMYKEDKKLAINTVNKRPDLFNIKKQKGFTLRKVSIIEVEKDNSTMEI
jgi:hypothetical protein